jgi:hypothetical protein
LNDDTKAMSPTPTNNTVHRYSILFFTAKKKESKTNNNNPITKKGVVYSTLQQILLSLNYLLNKHERKMNTEMWDPNANTSSNIDSNNYRLDNDFLRIIINTSKIDDSSHFKSLLTENEIRKHRDIMFLTKEVWFEALENFNEDELIALIHFFTLAEVHFSNWHAEDKSPVISIAKLLRKRKHSLSKELLIWIKNNNKNKFLPFGPL